MSKNSPGNLFLFCLLFLSLFHCLPDGFSQEVTDNQTCFECHSDAELTGEINGLEVSMFVDSTTFENSVHGGFSCVDCHSDITEIPHEDPLQKVDCASCHEEAVQGLADSVHNVPDGPSCVSCHGEPHQILPGYEEASLTSRNNILQVCSQCHADDPSAELKVTSPHMLNPIETYMESVHGQALLNGNTAAASCSDCHNSHDVLLGTNPQSSVNKFNVAQTCGKCHVEVEQTFMASVHGEAISKRVADAPTCVDCHTEHAIFSPDDERSSVYATNVARDTCSRCHDSLAISARYGIPYGQVESFNDSYHGLAVKFGSISAANCASCHGFHNILPSSNPDSMIHSTNLPQTCGQCHAGATSVFINTKVHRTNPDETHWIIGVVRFFYLWAIPLIIGFMFLHNLLIYIHHIRVKIKYAKQHGIRRFNTADIIQHSVLAITFIGLVITGFALVYSSSWWVAVFAWMGLTEELRSSLHRIFAVLFILCSIYHLYYVLFRREGRYKIKEMIPAPSDVGEAVKTVAHYTGNTAGKPERKGFYSYDEKAEYWALVWGGIVMIITGIILWFPFETMAILPHWVVELAELVHFYEAWLATLAILVWHFFFTIFHPAEYPMNVAWLTGYNIHAEHQTEVEDQQAGATKEIAQDSDSRLTGPSPEEDPAG